MDVLSLLILMFGLAGDNEPEHASRSRQREAEHEPAPEPELPVPEPVSVPEPVKTPEVMQEPEPEIVQEQRTPRRKVHKKRNNAVELGG